MFPLLIRDGLRIPYYVFFVTYPCMVNLFYNNDETLVSNTTNKKSNNDINQNHDGDVIPSTISRSRLYHICLPWLNIKPVKIFIIISAIGTLFINNILEYSFYVVI